MDLGIQNEAFVILGGSRGMGAATAEVLASEGARVAILGHDPDRAREFAIGLNRRHGCDAVGLALPANDSKSFIEAMQSVRDQFGAISGLAAVAGPMGPRGDFLTLDDADWAEHIETQLMLTVRACRAALPHLLEKGDGRLVTTAAYSVRSPKANLSPYASMKSAIVNLTKNLAKAYGAQGLRANCVCPGMIETHALAEARAGAEEQYGHEAEDALYLHAERDWGMKIALRRVGKPEEVGELVAFLLSRRAGYLTGATINIDGGTDF